MHANVLSLLRIRFCGFFVTVTNASRRVVAWEMLWMTNPAAIVATFRSRTTPSDRTQRSPAVQHFKLNECDFLNSRKRHSSHSPPTQICDNRTFAVWPAQNNCVATALVAGPHQSFPLPDIARPQVFAFGPDSAQRHQAGKSVGEQQLRAEDLWFRFGTRRRARPIQAHDAGGGDAILPRPRDPNGCPPLLGRRWCVVGRLHFRGATRPADNFSSSDPCTTGEK